jgi:hypothetical protein
MTRFISGGLGGHKRRAGWVNCAWSVSMSSEVYLARNVASLAEQIDRPFLRAQRQA